MGIKVGGKRTYEQGDIKWRKFVKVTGNFKCRKAWGINGITSKILKYGEKTAIDRKHNITLRYLTWKKDTAPGDWTKASVIPVSKEKDDKNECINYRGINIIKDKINQEGGFRKGMGLQIRFSL